MVSSNYLKALAAMRQNMTDPTRRLQLIATDTWDISDDLSKYNVSDLLEVSGGRGGRVKLKMENSLLKRKISEACREV